MNARRSVLWTLSVVLGALIFASAPALALNKHVYSSSFGSEGSGSGQFSGPWSIAVSEVGGASGDVYVPDFGNNRVEVFNSAGTYLSQFNGSAAPTGAFSFAEPVAIAVDNSTNPLDLSAGDVYVADTGHRVIDKFTSSGTYIGQITSGAGGQLFGQIGGVAVDPNGTVWVAQRRGEIDSFSDTLANEFISSLISPVGERWGFAVDAEDDLYVSGESFHASKLDSSGKVLNENIDAENAYAIAVNTSTDDVYIDNGTTIGVFTASGLPLERFGAGHLSAGSTAGGIAVNSSNGVAYAADFPGNTIGIFTTILVPDVVTGETTNLQTEGSATLNGTVNPDGVAVTSCEFEYGTTTSYGSTAACSPSPGSGSADVAVSANLTVASDTIYHYRLVAANANGEHQGEDRTFMAAARPSVTGESFSGIGSTEATISAQINPGGSLTTYRVEYGTSAIYGSVTPETIAGAGLDAASVQVQLSGLQSGTVYHARVVAKNFFGTSLGGDLTFTTAGAVGASDSSLSDNRVYEMVSPIANADGNVYVPAAGAAANNIKDTTSASPYRASVDGDAVGYAGEPLASGGNGSIGEGQGNEFLATREVSGWTALDIQPPDVGGMQYLGFSPDLSLGMLTPYAPPNPPGEPLTTDAPRNCDVLYSRTSSDGAYHAAFTTTQTPGECGSPRFAGVSADDAHLIFESEASLTPGAVGGHVGEESELTYNLYESVGGRVYLVNVLPDGKPDVNATFGRAFGVPGSSAEGPEEAGATPQVTHDFEHVISDDGSRIVWTDLNTGHLYVRENADRPNASTVLVAAGGNYWDASGDGSKIFFTKSGDLYEYDLEAAATTDLAPGGEVMGVVGLGEDGSHVYFVAAGVLAHNENANEEKAKAGAPNLYVRDGGETRFIASLSPEDNTFFGPSPNNESSVGRFGDWRASLTRRTAEVTPDGQSVVFRSRRSLTGYDNNATCRNGEQHIAGCPEVFVYEAGAQRLSCASCNPTGGPPTAEGAYLPSPGFASETYMVRWIPEDGSRVFFDTAEPLVPQDTNGVLDVYEWERDGAGSCRQSGGCVYLISGNISGDQAFLVDASATGDDVFFTSRGQLVAQDGNENVDLYDARVNGGFPRLSTECTGSGCQGVPPAPPIFATPSSVTFTGLGNFEPPSKQALKAKSKPSRCKKGFVRKGRKCVKRKARKSSVRSKRGRK
jgi:hypothetical protein